MKKNSLQVWFIVVREKAARSILSQQPIKELENQPVKIRKWTVLPAETHHAHHVGLSGLFYVMRRNHYSR